MSFHSPLFLRGLESGACSVLMFVISPSPRCYCSASQQAWHRLTHGLLSYGAGTVARLQLLGGYQYLCFFVSLRDPASLPPPPPPPPPVRVVPFFLHSSVSFSSPCCFFSLSRTLSPTFFCHPFLCVSLPHLLSSHRPPSHISLSHILVATLKTVVAMATAMCCGNVKESNPPRITSLFLTLKFFCAVSLSLISRCLSVNA